MPSEVEASQEADRFGEAPHPRKMLYLFGHSEIEKELLGIYRSGRLPHAILIGGPEGIGKATLAWRFARFLLANPNPSSRSCLAANDLFVPRDHVVTRQIDSLAHPDLCLLRRTWSEKAHRLYKDIRIDDIREVNRIFQQGAGQGGYRICIVDKAEDLNPSSANALLKTIEEPPPRSLFLIIAVAPNRLLPTIRSRCHKIVLKALSELAIRQVIEAVGPPWSESVETDKRIAGARARGCVHNALRLLGGLGLELDRNLRPLLESLPNLDWRHVQQLAELVAQSSDSLEFDMMLEAIFDWLHERVRRGAEQGHGDAAHALAAYATAWERLAADAREDEYLNLDKRPFVLSAFAALLGASKKQVIS